MERNDVQRFIHLATKIFMFGQTCLGHAFGKTLTNFVQGWPLLAAFRLSGQGPLQQIPGGFMCGRASRRCARIRRPEFSTDRRACAGRGRCRSAVCTRGHWSCCCFGRRRHEVPSSHRKLLQETAPSRCRPRINYNLPIKCARVTTVRTGRALADDWHASC